MAREGIPYVLVPLILFIAAAMLGWWIAGAIFLVLAAFMAFFFRDPKRDAPSDDNIIVSPADGRVTRVCPTNPNETDSPVLISIFLSPFDVHINRSPIAGKITDITYTNGRFLSATRNEASLVNEQNALTIANERVTVTCKQIAGILARRIVCWKKAGDSVLKGERFGMIKFSSRTDLILPAKVEVLATEGMRVLGGLTVVGRFRS